MLLFGIAKKISCRSTLLSKCLFLSLTFSVLSRLASGFSPQSGRLHNPSAGVTDESSTKARHPTSRRAKNKDDDGVYRKPATNNDDDMKALFKSLNNRVEELQKDEHSKRNNILSSSCASRVAAVFPDWVRRLDVDYPLVVCGSSSSDIYLADLERGTVLGVGKRSGDDVPSSAIAPERLGRAVRQMFGQFDGGGTLAVAIKRNLVCAAGRSGSVDVWRIDQQTEQQGDTERTTPIFQGSIAALQGCLVTALEIVNELLFVGTDDGRVEAYSLSSLPLSTKPEFSWKVGNGNCIVLDLSVHIESGLMAVATDSGSVDLLCLDDDETNKPVASFMPPFDTSERKQANVFPTAVTVVDSVEDEGTPTSDQKSYTIACGSNDGSVYHQSISRNEGQEVMFNNPIEELGPRHFGSVQCMISPLPGILITGAHDGTLRVWDLDKKEFQYQFIGYKVWLGSLWSDGVRVLSDGADNSIISHVFSSGDSDKNQ